MKKRMIKRLGILIVLFTLFFCHQYKYAGPYDAIIRQENISVDTILKDLKQWRYHTYVWFEPMPDAFTTVFKRLGLGGFTETGHRACVTGCVYWTEKWTDGFYSIDLEMDRIAFDQQPSIKFDPPRYMDIEIWGAIRRKISKTRTLPQIGEEVEICGPLRIDRPYYVYTLQPDHPEEVRVTGTCEVVTDDFEQAFEKTSRLSCDEISALKPKDQIALLNTLITPNEKKSDLPSLLQKIIPCVQPVVLQALATDGDVYEEIVALAPSVKSFLPPLSDDLNKREGNPVMNTIRDLLKNWF